MGGLSRKAHVIRQYLHETNGPVLILDAGALLFDLPVLAPSQVPGKKELAEGIMQAMLSMQYNAIGIAPQDISGGIEFLESLQDKYAVPFVSANLVRKNNGDTVFKPFIRQRLDDISVAVLGLTGIAPGAQNSALLKNVSVLPWQKAIPKTLHTLGNSADMIILLSSLPEQTNREIAQQFKEINLILQAGHSAVNRAPQHFGNSLITQTAGKGKYVGWMDINWTMAKKWRQDYSPRLKTSRNQLDRISWRLERMEKKYPVKNLKENAQYQELQKEKSSLLNEIEEIKKLQQQTENDLATYRYRAIDLKKALPEDPEVRSIVAVTKQRIYEINKKRLNELTKKSGKTNISASMAGWKSCRSCHLEQTAFWEKTAHAKAWDTLTKTKRQFNQDCLICHVTLPTYDQEIVIRDNLIAALTPEFHGVSCEACHGPAKKHVEKPEQNRVLRPTVQTCVTCHTPDHDDNFNFDRKVKIVRCPVSKT